MAYSPDRQSVKPIIQLLQEWWRKVMWAWAPESERESSEAIVRNLWLHWFPAKVSRRSMSWSYSLWLGTATACLFFILTVTGVMLMFFYVPSTERAYGSIKDLQFAVSFGRLLRNQHRWAAEGMVAVVFLHLARVFFTGAYRGPRAINWLNGVVLFLATLLLSFTGYLLPWDQLAFWAITVGTNIASQAPWWVRPSATFCWAVIWWGNRRCCAFTCCMCFFFPPWSGSCSPTHVASAQGRRSGGARTVTRPAAGPGQASPAYQDLFIVRTDAGHVGRCKEFDGP